MDDSDSDGRRPGPTQRGQSGRPSLAALDRHIGARLRRRRLELGLSQQALGASLNLSYQQIQKYERGANRISSGVLWQLGEFLAVPHGYFFEGLDRGAGVADKGNGTGDADGAGPGERELLELVKVYGAIADLAVRKGVRMLLAAVARSRGDGAAPTRRKRRAR